MRLGMNKSYYDTGYPPPRPDDLSFWEKLHWWWNRCECLLLHKWDDKNGATRVCVKCGRVETMMFPGS